MNNQEKKLWSGRFASSAAQILEEYNASIVFDYKLYREDITGSLAHVKMLAKQNIITASEAESIAKALIEIREEISQDPRGWAMARISDEDIHMAVEKRLTEMLGDTAKKLHTARSRNDQVVTDLRLWMKNEVADISNLLKDLKKSFLDRAELDINILVPGYTHLQQAQAISLGHFWLAHEAKFSRDLARLEDALKRIDVCPLGSGALAGSTFNINRDFTAKELGFSQVSNNSLDAVADRDFVVEFEFVLSMIMVHLSQFAEEMIVWNSQEFSFIEINDAYATGSSMMPQKKNPDIPELLRGKAGRVIGVMNALMITLKGLSLTYNKDLQEDKEQLFMASETVKKSLTIAADFLKNIEINSTKMLEALEHSFTNATDAAEYLVKKGLPFRDAYTIVGKAVAYSIKESKFLHNLSLEEWQSFSEVFSEDIIQTIKIANCVDARNVYGATARSQVKQQIARLKEVLETYE
ncbi:MAG: argininosuccinate lyase [Candidatus Caenarcaniphilales bacterium]|nr:argininosuccinate lyase [Candidatus Caenarcaniphilales bacterium]